MRVIAFVPAKGESERIKSKNLRILDGEYLFKRKLCQLLECDLIDEVYLDTDSDEIIKFAADLPVKIMKRDPALATNATDGHELFANECKHVPEADLYIQCLCTAPFVDAGTLRRAIEALRAEPDCDSLVGVTSAKVYRWEDDEPVYGRGRIPNSVDLDPIVLEAMSLYIVRRTSPVFPNKRFGVKPKLFSLSPREAIDINFPEDLQLAESVCVGERQKEAQRFRTLKAHLASSNISDLTKELGLECTLPAQIRPMSGTRMLGRAKTLRLSALNGRADRDRGEWKGIYNALNSYEFVRSGDIIVVSTEVPDRAYFGELNAHLALRAGAVGVVVDGYTRDIEAVRPLELPVFARGVWCNDIKYEGTTGSMNEPINIGNVAIANGDLIFADHDGCVAIPVRKWPSVLEESIKIAVNESRIRINAALGIPVDELLGNFGYF